MNELVNAINGYIWSLPLIYLCLGVGLYFSLRTRFLQVRHVKEMVRLMFQGGSSAAGISSFQALALSLSGRVGTGNIAGVATAITFGGPGAVFWMWVVAFLGAGTAFVESALAQIYKEKDDNGLYRGGPAFYIEKGLGMKWYAWIFAISTVLACGMLLPGVQANSIASGIEHAFGIPTTVSAAGVVILLGMIIFGGVKRIAHFTQIVVPFMALGYILVAFVIIVLNIGQVPEVVSLIVGSAFGLKAGFGAILGLAIEWGVKRGIYSNEAGQGTGPHAAAAAEVSHPAKQGLVQSFSVYIDYAEAHNVPLKISRETNYSKDKNLWHLSHEGLDLEDPANEPKYEKPGFLEMGVSPVDAPDVPTYVTIGFEKGVPVSVDGVKMKGSDIVRKCNELGGKNGIGLLDIVENRLVGMKDRGVYETPGGTILYHAHAALEMITVDKDTAHMKSKLAVDFADLIYNGKWFSPLREALSAFADKTQEYVTGEVRLKLYKGNIISAGITSPHSLYSENLVTFEESDYNQNDATGFINLWGLPDTVQALREQHKL